MPEWDAVAATAWQRQLEYGIQLQRQLPMRDSSPFERAAAVLCSSAGYRINSAVLSEDNLRCVASTATVSSQRAAS